MDYFNWKLRLLLLLYLRRRRRFRRMYHASGRRRGDRRWWICPSVSRRLEFGTWEHFVQELLQDEPEKFLNFHRMTSVQFFLLLRKVEPVIQRNNVIRAPIPAGLKLSLTLRYLASGDSMLSLAYSYRIGKATVSEIIAETCLAIWSALHEDFLSPPTRDGWKKIADDFNELWNFPNCVGAIDGKHVVIQCFKNTGSTFYNYKGTFSTILLACCDAHYRFTLVSIGSAGRESDGGIFQSSPLGKSILTDSLPLPEEKVFNGFRATLPAVFVGDAAFPLRTNLMRPYPGANLPPAETIFNYRLSRCRRVIENAFGVLATRFRIFRKPIIACASTVDKIVQATCVLHNWLRTQDIEGGGQPRYMPPDFVDHEVNGILRPGEWREDGDPAGFIPVAANAARNPANDAKTTRENLRDYFMTVGEVYWQWYKLPNYLLQEVSEDEDGD